MTQQTYPQAGTGNPYAGQQAGQAAAPQGVTPEQAGFGQPGAPAGYGQASQPTVTDLDQVPEGAAFMVQGTVGFNRLDHWQDMAELQADNANRAKQGMKSRKNPSCTLTVEGAQVVAGQTDPLMAQYLQAVIAKKRGRLFLDRTRSLRVDPATGQYVAPDPAQLPRVWALDPELGQYTVVDLQGYVASGVPCTVSGHVYRTPSGNGKEMDDIFLGTPQAPVVKGDPSVFAAAGPAGGAPDAFAALGFAFQPATQAALASRGPGAAQQPQQGGQGQQPYGQQGSPAPQAAALNGQQQSVGVAGYGGQGAPQTYQAQGDPGAYAGPAGNFPVEPNPYGPQGAMGGQGGQQPADGSPWNA